MAAETRPLPAGLAALGAIVAFVLVGVLDGAVAYARTPSVSRRPALLAWAILHCAGSFASLGLVAASVQECFIQAAARRPTLRGLGAWLLAGPRRWWAYDERAALVLAASAAGAVPAGVALVAVVAHITRTFHSRELMVLPLALAVPSVAVFAVLTGVVASWPLASLLRRAKPLASVGAVACAAVGIVVIPAVWGLARYWRLLAAGDLLPLVLTGVLVSIDVGVVVTLLRRPLSVSRRSRTSTTALACVIACVALGAVPAFGLGQQRSIMAVVAQRSALTRRVIGPLQRVYDRDGDGHGVLFGGGDCDDRDARVYPGASEVPDNGVDENCSGRDAPYQDRNSHGAYATLTGPLAEQPPSVLFVSLDAARPDHLSAYGYRRPTTPALARFATRAARFTRAYAVAPGSLRSFAAAFTGRYPADVAWGRGSDPNFPALADENETLAEALRDVGYATAAFTNTSYFSLTPGFFQGFDDVREAALFKDDDAPIVRSAAEWIERPRARPFFAWVHLIDAHAPYGDHTWPQEFGHAERDCYDEEIARADAFAAQVLDAADRVERRGVPLLVVVFSDHGEGFNEHGALYHFSDVHEESIRVPLLVRGLGIAPGDRHALTALFDLYPTVLNFARRPINNAVPSRSLVPVLLDPHGAAPLDWREEVYADVAEHGGGVPSSMALVAPPWKIVFDAPRNVWELYDLARDPSEQHNLCDDEPTRARDLRARLLDRGHEPRGRSGRDGATPSEASSPVPMRACASSVGGACEE